MKGHYITDHITSIENLNRAYETMFKGSTFNCIPANEKFYSEGKGIITDDFYIGNFVTSNLKSIQAYNINDCIVTMPRQGNYDTTALNKTVKNKANTSGNIICLVDEVLYHNPSEISNAYDVYIKHQHLLRMLETKFGIHKFENYFQGISFNNEKVKTLFNYVGSTIHVAEIFISLRESLVAKMNIKEITILMVTDLIGELLHKKSLLNESPDKKIVIQAEEIMASDCENITTVQEIADKVYTSPRNLQKAFKKYRDYTPLQFLKKRKLQRAHHLLNDPYRSASIKNIAINVGIFDLNRFGKYYYEQFGEYPSETVNRKNQ